MEYYEKDFKVALEIGDWTREGGAYENLGNSYRSLDDYEERR